METKMKEQALQELNLNELEMVIGGYIPNYPHDPDDDENSNDNGGGATGGW